MNEHPNAAIIRSVYEAMEKQMCPPSRRSSTTALPDPSLAWVRGRLPRARPSAALLGKVFQETGVEMSHISIHDILADDDHAVILHDTTLTRKGRTFTGQYADIYHLRDGKITEHWHLAVDPKANEEFLTAEIATASSLESGES